MGGSIRGVLTSVLVIGMLLGAGAASAAPPERGSDAWVVSGPDVDNELVVLINATRDDVCTPEQIAFEEAVIAWLEAGEVGPFPEEPELVGLEPAFRWQTITTGKGAVVGRVAARGVYVELWVMDQEDQRPLVGPCTDTDDSLTLFASGTVDWRAGDNDLDSSGTRGNAFGERFRADVVTPEGDAYIYTWRFHVNDRCLWPEGDAPRCLMDRTSLSAR